MDSQCDFRHARGALAGVASKKTTAQGYFHEMLSDDAAKLLVTEIRSCSNTNDANLHLARSSAKLDSSRHEFRLNSLTCCRYAPTAQCQ